MSWLHVRGDRLGLGDLLGLQALALEHVLEVHVAADVELVGAVEHHAAVLEQLGQHPVGDGRADLGLDVVADDRDAGVLELLGPHRVGGDEHRQRVDEGDARVDGALRVELVGHLGAHGQVGHQHVGLGVLEHLRRRRPARRRTRRWSRGSTCRGRRGCGPRCTVTPSGGTSAILIVLFSDAAVASERSKPTFFASTSNAATNSTSRDVVVAELDVHEARDRAGGVGVAVVLDALDEGGGAVADSHDCYSYRTHRVSFLVHFSRVS